MTTLPRGLFRAYAIAISAVVALAVLAGGALQAFLVYQQSIDATASRLSAEATRAAARIDRFADAVAGQVQSVVRLIDSGHATSAEAIRIELYRLMKLAPAVIDARHIDAAGREQTHLGRFASDEFGSGIDWSHDQRYAPPRPGQPLFGPVHFHRGSEPMTTLAVRSRRGDVIAVDLSLKPVHAAIGGQRIGATGFQYIVDSQGRLIARPDLNRVLARSDLSDSRHVAAAISAGGTPSRALVSDIDGGGRRTVSSSVPLSVPGWQLIAEQARSEALAPVFASLWRSALLLVACVSLGVGASLWLARRAVRRITRLRDGAERIGSGDLAHRIPAGAKDELGDLALRFNRMAEALQTSYAGLETQVRSRTAELAQRKDDAERANAAKTRFLAAASHDLRQPMHTIALLVGLLRERIRFPEVREIVDGIHASVRAMEKLFGGLLDISQLDAGTVRALPRAFAVDELLRLVELCYAPQAAAKGLRLRVPRSRGVLRSDPALLERALGNLVANAIRYTDRGTVLVGCRRRGAGVAIQVWDTGHGIAAQHLDQVFEEFFQLRNPERDRSKGLGLGLAIVKRSVELLGHQLQVKSWPGKGSMFGVVVPFAPEAEAALLPAAAATADTAAGADLAAAFVVVIDDEAQSTAALARLLRGWGAQVIAAESERSALEQLAEHLRGPDLIITDYRLREGRTGLMAIEAIRRAAAETVPAIVVTGDLSVGASLRGLPEQVQVMHKPIDVQRLRALAGELCARRDAAVAAQQKARELRGNITWEGDLDSMRTDR
ncbi:MAG TPA: ATP-binding protein [Rubrivivax sp.]|nr:ATP-binding protein [Rubrivivax sp.]HPO17605.1 ATP-binding protein [Rubrivivax sp.]